MPKVIERTIQAAFVVGIVGALAVGGQAAFAGDRALDCICDPDDPGRDDFCVECCMSEGSICPLGAGGLRECLCV
jgi:hypothetical protein